MKRWIVASALLMSTWVCLPTYASPITGDESGVLTSYYSSEYWPNCYDRAIEDGGVGSDSASSWYSDYDALMMAAASLSGDSLLPELHAYSKGSTDVEPFLTYSSFAFGVQKYTYDGDVATTITLDVVLDSSVTYTSAYMNVVFAMVAVYYDDVDFYELLNAFVTEGITWHWNYHSWVYVPDDWLMNDGGSDTVTMSITLALNPGDSFYVASGLMAHATGDGISDASHTLTMSFSDDTGLVASSQSNTDPVSVPAPAAWLLMLLMPVGLRFARRR